MSELIKSLEENEFPVYLEVTDILLKIINNILHSPQNPKFRRLRLGNDIVSNKLLPAIGAMECLFSMGFVEANDSLVLPETVALTKLKDFRTMISTSRSKHEAKRKNLPLKITHSNFLDDVRHKSKHALIYEDQNVQELARKKIPLDKLKEKSEEKAKHLTSSFEIEFALLYEVMMWFKTEFFEWMNKPDCKQCNSSSTFKGYSTNPADFIYTDRVEVYSCEKCETRLLFPRYNNPIQLLESRTGRCGEWANCFTLFCVVIGFDARYVVDKTDHVWTEVYSQSQKRWVHIDPCEGAIDTPLMYEKGWNKKLSYVIAFSKDEVQDVTWRYTCNFTDVLSRRNLCSESDLVRVLLNTSEELQSSLLPERKKILAHRRALECVELLTEPKSDKEFEGRSSGSLAWRLSRGEAKVVKSKMIEWKPNGAELQRKQFKLRYSAALDKYQRVELEESIDGWENGVFELENIFRKVEHDWKVAYLCRTENSDNGSIKWKFSTEGTDLVIDTLKVSYASTVFENGHVRWILCNDETCIPLKSTETLLETEEFRESTEVTLTVMLSGGAGDSAWQQAQLFRQPTDCNKYLFEIAVTLKSK